MRVLSRKQWRIAWYLLEQKLKRSERYPLVLMLEPLFRCNLACRGCGKIDHPDEILDRRMTVEQALAAVDECDAPAVSIAGGEPLIHADLPRIVAGIVARKKLVYVCTNALLLKKKIHLYEPSPYLTFSIHLDGNRRRHDASVCQTGVYDRAVEAVDEALARGHEVTIACTLFQGETPEEVADFFDHVTELGVQGITVSPGFSYARAPRQDVFLQRRQTKELFRGIFRRGKGRRWPLLHSGLYLDFLAGNQTYRCTAWGNPTYTVLGWQKPCYLLMDEGYAASYRELMDDTDWEHYGTGRNPKCANCMAHCGYEATAVDDAVSRPLKALRVALRGPRTEGPMAPELPVEYPDDPADAVPDSPPASSPASTRRGGARLPALDHDMPGRGAA